MSREYVNSRLGEPSPQTSTVGSLFSFASYILLIRAGIEFGLDKFGQGVGKFLATGTYLHKDRYNNPTIEGRNDALISSSGFFDGENYHEFDHLKVKEDVSHSWYDDQEDGLHPWDEPLPTPAKSQPLHHTDFDGQYSWAKSPRYDGHAAETGPLARVIMNANPNNKEHQMSDEIR